MAAGFQTSTDTAHSTADDPLHKATTKKRNYADIAFLAKSASASQQQNVDHTAVVTMTTQLHSYSRTPTQQQQQHPLISIPSRDYATSTANQKPPAALTSIAAALSSGTLHALVSPMLLQAPPALTTLYSGHHHNVCAQCGAVFRLTADLVHHMRQQHRHNRHNDHSLVPPIADNQPRPDSGDSENRSFALQTRAHGRKRNRQTPLVCVVCGETFRERHHLTRHMTAHKYSEREEEEQEKQRGS